MCVFEVKRERVSGRERRRKREKERKSKKERETERKSKKERETERESGRKTKRNQEKQTETEINREGAFKHFKKDRDRQINKKYVRDLEKDRVGLIIIFIIFF